MFYFNKVKVFYKPETMVEKTARYISTGVKKLVSPEEDDEEAAYDRADDLVRPETRYCLSGRSQSPLIPALI